MDKYNLDKKQAYDLRKKEVEEVAQSKGLGDEVSRVALVIDSSGSMGTLYKNGTVQKVIERILPIAAKFDDNHELDCWIFGDKFCRLPNVTEGNYVTYVDKILLTYNAGGGTAYAPVLYDVFQRYVSQEPVDYPSYVIFITDGENSDKSLAETALKELSKYNLFFQFVGIGSENFAFLKALDTMQGRMIDNANFFALNDLNKITDKELYDRLFQEYPLWIAEARRLKLIKPKAEGDGFLGFISKLFK
jgi:uncharacterized protein with von Willebrand factor type A (vWA) domain